MKIWHISQATNVGYDTYDSAVVAAETADDARQMHPYNGEIIQPSPALYMGDWVYDSSLVTARLLGEAEAGISAGVICASFNAG